MKLSDEQQLEKHNMQFKLATLINICATVDVEVNGIVILGVLNGF